jgi:ACS family hexuronate transporter-like MFS transporter
MNLEKTETAPGASAWAWGLCWLMFGSTILNYMDRQTISLVSEQIRASFAIKEYVDFGWVISSFFMTYALFQVPAGFLVDRFSLRASYAAAVAWWSLAAVATSIVPSLGWLIVCRALLGVGESFNWPCALRVTARVLPPRDRSLGNGIFNSGAAVGAVATPLVVSYLTPAYGWRVTFVIIGSAGFVWVAAWLLIVRGERRSVLAGPSAQEPELDRPEPDHAGLSPAAAVAFGGIAIAAIGAGLFAARYGREAVSLVVVAIAILGPLLVASLLPARDLEGSGWARSLREVVHLRRFWILVCVSITINVCWHFLVNWIPIVLKGERHLSERIGNYLTAAIFLAADVGNLGGGWFSRHLVSRNMSVASARKTVMGICLLLIVIGPAVSVPQSHASAIVLLSVMAAGTAAFMANYFAFTQEVSSQHTGLVVGYLGAVGNLFVAGFQPLAGKLRDMTGSFTATFLIVGLAPLVGMAALFWGWDDRTSTTVKATKT